VTGTTGSRPAHERQKAIGLFAWRRHDPARQDSEYCSRQGPGFSRPPSASLVSGRKKNVDVRRAARHIGKITQGLATRPPISLPSTSLGGQLL
jgi:hypothetical protein